MQTRGEIPSCILKMLDLLFNLVLVSMFGTVLRRQAYAGIFTLCL